ncbi:hypothetical protein NBRC116188_17840 [Oceaniserpentilla sp. 4NH20-0058]
MIQLRKEYIGWDKSAQIGVISPRTGTVTTHFEVTQAQFEVDVVNDNGKLIAKALKTLYIRNKPKK